MVAPFNRLLAGVPKTCALGSADLVATTRTLFPKLRRSNLNGTSCSSPAAPCFRAPSICIYDGPFAGLWEASTMSKGQTRHKLIIVRFDLA